MKAAAAGPRDHCPVAVFRMVRLKGDENMLAFITGHLADLIICAVLAVLFFLAIRFLVKKKGNACGCGGGCAGCSAGAGGASGCAHCGAMKLPDLEELRAAQETSEERERSKRN